MKLLGLDRASLHYGLRLALAAWLAFSIAAFLHVENAYWAAMPIWVVAQSSRGLMLERGFFRVVGTLLGGAVGFVLLHMPGAPLLPLGLLAVWVAVCAALTHMLRGVHSYGALMSGMTAGVVVLPSLLMPEHSLELALARVECTLIGVLVVTVVTGLFTPVSRRQAFYERVRQLSGDAVAFAAEELIPAESTDRDARERRLLAEMSDIDANGAMVAAGSIEGYRRLEHVHALVMASLAVMAAARALRDRQRRGETLPEGIGPQLQALAAQLRAERPTGAPTLVPAWAEGPALGRLSEALAQLVSAEAALFAEPREADARNFGHKASYWAPHRDWGLGRDTGLACGAATFLAGALSLAFDSSAATLAATGVCIFSLVLGTMATPQFIAPKLLTGVIVGVVVATGYRFMVQPHLTTVLALIASVAPFILLGGLARASSRTAIPALDANMSFLLASQAGMPAAPPAEILSGSAALLLGAAPVSLAFMAMPNRAHRQAREVKALIHTDLRRLIEAPARGGPWHPRTGRQVLRLMLHLERASELGSRAPGGLLAALNLGHAIVALQALEPDAPAHRRALATLQAFEADPLGTAEALERHAEGLGPEASAALYEAADALRDGAAFLASRPKK